MGTDQLSIDRSICPNCPLLLFCVGRSTIVVRSHVAQVFVIASVNFRVMPWAVRSPPGATMPRTGGQLACLHSADARKVDPVVVLWGVRQHVRGFLPLRREVLACDWRPFEECAAVGSQTEILDSGPKRQIVSWQSICCSMRRTNTSKLTDAMFIVWWNKAVHHSMSHMRELATYPERFRYRVSKLDEYQKIALEELRPDAKGSRRQKLLVLRSNGQRWPRREMMPSSGPSRRQRWPQREPLADVEQRLAKIKRALSATSGACVAATEMATSGANADVEKRLSRIKSALSVFSEALDDKPESENSTTSQIGGEAPRELQNVGNCPEDAAVAVVPEVASRNIAKHMALSKNMVRLLD